MKSEGKLYIVSTPIGNIEDISFRAVEILRNSNFIYCEDTRVSALLMKKYEIKAPLISFNSYNEEKKTDKIITQIKQGLIISIISDAGTPCISDPGGKLVNEAHKQGIIISAIPGPNAAITALSLTGFPTSNFIFLGFPPQKKGRTKFIDSIALYEITIVLYESSHRIIKLIDEFEKKIPERKIFVFRELTKKFEDYFSGTPSEVKKWSETNEMKGEFVVVISPIKWK